MSILKQILFSLHSTIFHKVIESGSDVGLPLHMWEDHKQVHKQVQVKIHLSPVPSFP